MIIYAFNDRKEQMVFIPADVSQVDLSDDEFNNIQEIQNKTQLYHLMKYLLDWPGDVTPENDPETKDLYDALDEIWERCEYQKENLSFEYFDGRSYINPYEID